MTSSKIVTDYSEHWQSLAVLTYFHEYFSCVHATQLWHWLFSHIRHISPNAESHTSHFRAGRGATVPASDWSMTIQTRLSLVDSKMSENTLRHIPRPQQAIPDLIKIIHKIDSFLSFTFMHDDLWLQNMIWVVETFSLIIVLFLFFRVNVNLQVFDSRINSNGEIAGSLGKAFQN